MCKMCALHHTTDKQAFTEGSFSSSKDFFLVIGTIWILTISNYSEFVSSSKKMTVLNKNMEKNKI